MRSCSTRRGIPVSLAVLWLELAQAIGMHAQGISFPGHFLVKVALKDGLVVMDPAHGRVAGCWTVCQKDLSPYSDGADQIGRSGFGRRVKPLGFVPASLSIPRCAGPHAAQPERNFFARKKIGHACCSVLDRLVVLLPEVWTERRDRGLVHAELGHVHEALWQDLRPIWRPNRSARQS
jgi:regulator of sirC expression with transglutaminase-like and TPR domain